ncbi:hypothetical protein BC826DRAFT_1102599 [Russula brevipes]|nr:hypothetical protein BC826DRAFT_1102599 [Russula brevipes]
MSSDHRPQMLDVEDEEQRQQRLQHILERLNGESASAGESPNLSFDFGMRRTNSMEPPTELLARVQQFLPEIERSNAELLQRDPRSIDIEHIEDADERIIEMASLGVFEQRQAPSRHSVPSSSSETSFSRSPSRATYDTSSGSSASSSLLSSSSDSEDEGNGEYSPCLRAIRPLPKRSNPVIQLLATKDEEGSSAGDRILL